MVLTYSRIKFKELYAHLDLRLYNFEIFRFFARLYAVYPLDEDTGKFEVYLDNALWGFFHVNYWAAALAEVNAIYKSGADLAILLSCGTELILMIKILGLMILFKIQKHRLQVS